MTNPHTLNVNEWTTQHDYATGDRRAMGILWELHKESLARQAYQMCRRNHDLADEALSELALKLLRPEVMNLYRPDEPWKRWAASVLRNLVWDLLRQKHRPAFRLTKTHCKQLQDEGVPVDTAEKLQELVGKPFWSDMAFQRAVAKFLSLEEMRWYWPTIRERATCWVTLGASVHENTADTNSLSPLALIEESELNDRYQIALDTLSAEMRAIVIMRISMHWSFARIAEVLYEERDPNLVSRSYYQAKALLADHLKEFSPTRRNRVERCLQTSA